MKIRFRWRPIVRLTRENHSAGFDIFLVSVFTECGLADWSLLTILLVSKGALCSHESQTEAGPVGSLPYVWREAG